MPPLKQRFSAAQGLGQREQQEDDYGLLDHRETDDSEVEHTLLVLADGMGGHVGGEAASQLAVRAFIDAYQTSEGPVTDCLRGALRSANEAIAAAIEENPELSGMGCTLIGAVVTRAGLQWVSVGDSLLWLYRRGKLQRLNADHSMAPVIAELVDSGRLTAEEAASDSRRNALRSALIGEELEIIDVSSQPVALGPDDVVLVASDGIQTLSDEQIADQLGAVEEFPEAARRLVDAVEGAGAANQDNTTILMLRPQQASAGRAADADDAEPAAPAEPPVPPVPPSKRSRSAAGWGALLLLLLAAGTGAWVYMSPNTGAVPGMSDEPAEPAEPNVPAQAVPAEPDPAQRIPRDGDSAGEAQDPDQPDDAAARPAPAAGPGPEVEPTQAVPQSADTAEPT